MSNHPVNAFCNNKDCPLCCGYIVGFVDGEGMFRLCKPTGRLAGFAEFAIKLRDDDSSILHSIKDFLGCGRVEYYPASKKGNPSCRYVVSGLDALVDVIIPFFENTRLRAKKARDFEIWKDGVHLIHVISNRDFKRIPTSDGRYAGVYPKWQSADVQSFISLRDKLCAVRKFRLPGPKAYWHCLDQNCLSCRGYLHGLIDGEGYFTLLSRNRRAEGTCRFGIKLRQDDSDVIENVQRFLGCGVVRISPSFATNHNPSIRLAVANLQHLNDIVIPLFDGGLRAKKLKDFKVWKQGVQLALNVKQRPFRQRGRRAGMLPKWTQAELQMFCNLVESLRGGRQYQMAGVTAGGTF